MRRKVRLTRKTQKYMGIKASSITRGNWLRLKEGSYSFAAADDSYGTLIIATFTNTSPPPNGKWEGKLTLEPDGGNAVSIWHHPMIIGANNSWEAADKAKEEVVKVLDFYADAFNHALQNFDRKVPGFALLPEETSGE